MLDWPVLNTALLVSGVGISVVAGALLLLIFTILILRFIFPADLSSATEEEKPENGGEEAESSEDGEAALAAAAVEHHRRQLQLGDRLKEGSKHLR